MTIFPEWQRLRPWFVRQQINGKKDIQHANNLFPSFFGSLATFPLNLLLFSSLKKFAQAWQINSRVELSHLQVFFLMVHQVKIAVKRERGKKSYHQEPFAGKFAGIPEIMRMHDSSGKSLHTWVIRCKWNRVMTDSHDDIIECLDGQ